MKKNRAKKSRATVPLMGHPHKRSIKPFSAALVKLIDFT
jgi:hypothetical protein